MIDDALSIFLKKKIEQNKKIIAEDLKGLNSVPLDCIPRVYFGLGSDAQTIAVYSLLLGHKDEALTWFTNSADYFIKKVESERLLSGTCSWESEAGRCKDSFDMALLSGDSDVIQRSIMVSFGICKEYPNKYGDFSPFYYYLLSFASFIQGSFSEAMIYLEKMQVDLRKDAIGLQSGRKTGLRGLITNDRSLLIFGLNGILEYHSMHSNTRMSYHLISVDATVLIKAARDKGLVITEDDLQKGLEKYIPWNLLE